MAWPTFPPVISGNCWPGCNEGTQIVKRLSWAKMLPIAVLSMAGILILAWKQSDSLCFFLLFGIGSALWLDRQAFRLLGIPAAESWKKESRTRLVFFLLGALPMKLIFWRSIRWVKDGTHDDFHKRVPDRLDQLRRFIERNL